MRSYAPCFHLEKDERVSHSTCVDCAIQETPDFEERDQYACNSCDLVVDALVMLTRFRVELGHLEAQYISVPGVVLVDRRRTGYATTRSIRRVRRVADACTVFQRSPV